MRAPERPPQAKSTRRGRVYEAMTAFLPRLREETEFGAWHGDAGQMPFVGYSALVHEFAHAMQEFVDAYPEMDLALYRDILEPAGLWGLDSFADVDVSALDGRTVMALIVAAVRSERFCTGSLLEFLQNGCLRRWLERLQAIDASAQPQLPTPAKPAPKQRRAKKTPVNP